jgi:hypothetical protein
MASMEEVKSKIRELSRGNPGATVVLCNIANELGPDEAMEFYAIFEDMNIHGCAVWLAYKDASGEDLGKMIENVRERSQAMVDAINRFYGGEKAVVRGASA